MTTPWIYGVNNSGYAAEIKKEAGPIPVKYATYIPRYMAENTNSYAYDADGKASLISITEPGGPEAALVQPWGAVLRIAFWDVTKRLEEGFSLASHPPGPIDPMTSATAYSMASFISVNYNMNIVVHCRQGKSRSAAVVKVLLDLGWEMHPTILPSHPIEGYNKHVYALLRQQFP